MATTQNILETTKLFETGFMCGKSLYLYCFNDLPNDSYLNNVDGKKAFDTIKVKYGHLIKSIHQNKYYDRPKKEYVFDDAFIIMENNCVIEFGNRYVEFFHNGKVDDFIKECTVIAQKFKERQRKKPLEINLISKSNNGLELKQLEVKPTKLDLDLFYEDDFKAVNEIICKRLKNDKDKGIVLLHGLPGSGKTTYLRYLIGKIKKRILFVSPNIAGELTGPDFIALLVNNPNSVLIIEDAENIILDRKISGNASVSNLLNISDGLLADFLNVQIICTFNNSATLVDSALMRKGRLIAKYEFGKLSADKAQKLSNHLGFSTVIDKPMTLAEISNPNQTEVKEERVAVLGFRREAIMN